MDRLQYMAKCMDMMYETLEKPREEPTITIYDMGDGHDYIENPNPHGRPLVVHWYKCRKCHPERLGGTR